MPDPEFNPDRDYATRRGFGAGLTTCQDGHMFNSHHVYLGPDPHYQPPVEPTTADEPVEESKAEVLRRAAAKMGGYVMPDDVVDARKENAKAEHAERLAD